MILKTQKFRNSTMIHREGDCPHLPLWIRPRCVPSSSNKIQRNVKESAANSKKKTHPRTSNSKFPEAFSRRNGVSRKTASRLSRKSIDETYFAL